MKNDDGHPPGSRRSKKRMSLTIPGDLIQSAKDLGLNISQAAEDGIAMAVQKERESAWLKENKAAIEAYNQMIERDGLPVTAYWIEEMEGRGEI